VSFLAPYNYNYKNRADAFSDYADSRETHFLPFTQRQEIIQSSSFFQCSCSRCRRGSSDDRGLQLILSLEQTLNDWYSGSTTTPRDALALIRLYERHGFQAFLDVPYGHAALAYNSVGDAEQAQKYARLATKTARSNGIANKFEITAWEQLAKNPRRHWSWLKRVN
jgi:hypothetical protein